MYIIDNKRKYKVKMCIKFKDRLLGLMFKKNINEILCFPKCNSIHTFFMFNNIDVYICDKDYNILYIYKNLKPFKIILPKKNVKYIFETKVDLLNFSIGNNIKMKDY